MSKFKVGDRVKAVGCLLLDSGNIGKKGVVRRVTHAGSVHVGFFCGAYDYGKEADFTPLLPAVNTEALKAALQGLHDQFRTDGNTVPALSLEKVISEHFGVTWQAPQEGRWVEKEYAE